MSTASSLVYIHSQWQHVWDTTHEVVNCAVKVLAEVLQDKLIDIVEKKRSKKKKKKYWVRSWVTRWNALGALGMLLKELRSEDEKDYQSHMKLCPKRFHELFPKISGCILCSDMWWMSFLQKSGNWKQLCVIPDRTV